MVDSLTACFLDSQAHTLQQAQLKIEHCFEQLNEEQVWHRFAPEQNSIGNLLLHLAGNLNQWGVVPFTTGIDQRDRSTEFVANPNVSSRVALGRLRDTRTAALQTWQRLCEINLVSSYTIQGFNVTGCMAITHTVAHFVGHAHQVITLTRQMLGDQYLFHWTPESKTRDLPV